jgi:hypothetical protein
MTGGERMNFDVQKLGLESWTRRKFMQMSGASTVSLGALKLADAESAP